MREPLRRQITLPMACVLLATLLAVSTLHVWLSGRRAQRQIEGQLRAISETLFRAAFPVDDRVLGQMRGLSGAEFVVVDRSGQAMASSRDDQWRRQLPILRGEPAKAGFHFEKQISLGDQTYLHARMPLRRTVAGHDATALHVLYPTSEYRRASQEAALPSLLAGSAALAVVILISRHIAGRVTQPIERLCVQVRRIARGDFARLEAPQRDDELRDLTEAINRMAEMLAQYEQDVRRHERLLTLGRLGGGIAHQLRNSATGCRMAIDLHARQCPQSDDEELQVARRQLELMEEYLGRFLSLGKCDERPPAPLDLKEVVESALLLVRHKAQHLGVSLQWSPPHDPLHIAGHPDALTQVVVNLLLNGIEAAVAQGLGSNGADFQPWLMVRLEATDTTDRARLDVIDSGVGPSAEVERQLFEPLVSDKPDGAGLGLSVAREVVERHGGAIRFVRDGQGACFSIELPRLHKTAASSVDIH